MGEKERTTEKWIGIAAVLVGILSVIATITVPETRRIVGLDDENPKGKASSTPRQDPAYSDVSPPTPVQPNPSFQPYTSPHSVTNNDAGLPKGAIGVPAVDSQLVEMWRGLDQINAVPYSNQLPR
jgi:hypothetical protein